MSKKISLLVLASGIGLIGLSLVQAYLVQNTYQLKQDAFWSATTAVAAKVEDTPGMAEITSAWQIDLRQILIDYQQGVRTKEGIISDLRQRSAILDTAYTGLFQRVLPPEQLAYGLKFQKRITALIIKDSLRPDTIFWATGAESPRLIGDDFPFAGSRKSGHSTSQVSLTYTVDEEGMELKKMMTFQVETDNLVSIKKWRKYILQEMQGILLVSVLIFLFVFSLLYYSIRSLMKQRKITEIKTDFINNITHEFKTPLATLSIAVKLLKENTADQGSGMVAEAVNIIDRQNRRLMALTDQVTDSTLRQTELKLRREAVAIISYLRTVFSDFLLSAADRKLSITHDFGELDEKVMLDRFYFTTAIINVLENAIKHNPEPVSLHCGIRLGECLELKIRDNGTGIPAKQQAYVFDKFYRGGQRETHETKGLGLGLYYTKQIVLAHGGAISLLSEEGHGTQITIMLPLQ